MTGSVGFSFKAGFDNGDALAGFRELKTQLIELRDQIKNTVSEVKVKITADTAALTQDVQQIKNTIKSQIGQVEVDVKLKADSASVSNSAATIKGQLRTALGDVDIALNLSANLAAMASDIAAIRNAINTQLGTSEIKLTIDVAHLTAQLAQIRTLIQNQLSGATSGLSLNINTGTLETTLRSTIATLIRAFRQLRDEIIGLRTSLSGLNGAGNASAAQLAALKNQVNQLRTQLDQLRNSSSGAGNAVSGLGGWVGSLKQQIIGLLGAYAGLTGASLFLKTTDEAKTYAGQLKLVTSSEQDLIDTRQRLLKMSDDAGVQMAGSVALYAKMYNATRNLNGVNGELLIRVTDITNKLVAIGGDSGESAAAGIFQFSQAMGSGVLRGEELNSVLEQTGGLAKGIAEGLGVSIGQLRKMAENGELTTEVVINALLKMGKTADKQFNDLGRKSSQATTALTNDLKAMVAELDKEWGFSQSFIDSVEWLRTALPEIKQFLLDVGDAAKIAGVALLLAFGAPALMNAVSALRIAFVALRLELFALSMQAAAAGGWRALITQMRSTQAATLSLKSAFGVFVAAYVGWEIGTYLRNEFEIVEKAGNKLGLAMFYMTTMLQKRWLEIKVMFSRDAEERKRLVQEQIDLMKRYEEVTAEDLPTGQQNKPQEAPTDPNAKTDTDSQRVTQKPVEAKIDTLEREKIRLQAAIQAEDEFTAKKRKNIIALGNIEIQLLEQQKKKNQSDAVELGKIDNQIYAQRLANQQALDDYDKQAGAQKHERAVALNDAQFNAEKAKIDYELQQVQGQYDAEEISAFALYEKKIELTQRLHNLELANLDSRINAETDGYKRSVLMRERETKRIALNTAGANLETEAQKAFRKITDDVIKTQKDILDDLEERDTDISEAGMTSLDKQLAAVDKQFKSAEKKIDELEKRLIKEGNLTVHMVEDGSEILVSKDVLEAYRARIEKQKAELKAVAYLQNKPDEIAKRSQSTIDFQRSQEEALERAKGKNPWQSLTINKSINETRLNAVRELQAQLAELEPLKDAGIAEVDEQIRSLKNNIAELQEIIPIAFEEFSLNFQKTAMSATESGIADFLTDIATGAESVSDAARNMARNFVSALARMAAEALAKMAIFALLNAFTGGGATAASSAASSINTGGLQSAISGGISAGVYHTGGIAGSGGTRRNINPADFIGAPKYHVGGVAGLAPGEMPAILKPGEEVLTLDNPRHIANGAKGQQSGTPVKIVNVFTREMALEHLASSEGEKVQLNTIERNSGAIKELLGLN